VADDIEMAAEDLRRAWSSETRQRWAIDRQPGDPRTPAFGLGQPATSPPAVRLIRLGAEHRELTALIPPMPTDDWRALSHFNGLRNAMRDLDTDNAYGVYAGTPLAEALQAWKTVHYQRSVAEMQSHEGPLLRRAPPGPHETPQREKHPWRRPTGPWPHPSGPASPPSWPTPSPRSPPNRPRRRPIAAMCASSTPRSPGDSSGGAGDGHPLRRALRHPHGARARRG
jgi:hypothetical protein